MISNDHFRGKKRRLGPYEFSAAISVASIPNQRKLLKLSSIEFMF